MQGEAMSKPDNHIDELGAILDKYAEHHFDQIEGFGSMHTLSKEEAIRQIEDFYRNKIPEIDWEIFNDAFEEEIKAQEFRIDEAEWMSLIKALKVAQETLTAQFNSRGKDNE